MIKSLIFFSYFMQISVNMQSIFHSITIFPPTILEIRFSFGFESKPFKNDKKKNYERNVENSEKKANYTKILGCCREFFWFITHTAWSKVFFEINLKITVLSNENQLIRL